jgi:hypothetical protein
MFGRQGATFLKIRLRGRGVDGAALATSAAREAGREGAWKRAGTGRGIRWHGLLPWADPGAQAIGSALTFSRWGPRRDAGHLRGVRWTG